MMNLGVEGEQEITPDDVKREKERIPMAAKPGFILDQDYNFWQRFIVDGALDAAKLQAGGYTGEQVPGITEEMNKLGWLGEQPSQPSVQAEPQSDASPES